MMSSSHGFSFGTPSSICVHLCMDAFDSLTNSFGFVLSQANLVYSLQPLFSTFFAVVVLKVRHTSFRKPLTNTGACSWVRVSEKMLFNFGGGLNHSETLCIVVWKDSPRLAPCHLPSGVFPRNRDGGSGACSAFPFPCDLPKQCNQVLSGIEIR